MFDTVNSIVASIQRKVDKLAQVAERETLKANEYSERAVTAQAEAERAHRVSKKIAALLQ